MEIIILGLVIVPGILILGLGIYSATRRGEACPRYPYECPYCRHSMECIIEIGRKDVRRDGDDK